MAIATGTAAIIGAAMALAGTAAGAASAARQAQTQKQQARYQSQLAARKGGAEDAASKRQETARIIGMQRAGAGASGAQVDAGGNLDRVLDTAEKGEMDALSLQQQGADAAYNQQLRAWGLRNQAESASLEAQYLRGRGNTDYLGLTTTLLNSAGRTGRNFFNLDRQGPRLP